MGKQRSTSDKAQPLVDGETTKPATNETSAPVELSVQQLPVTNEADDKTQPLVDSLETNQAIDASAPVGAPAQQSPVTNETSPPVDDKVQTRVDDETSTSADSLVQSSSTSSSEPSLVEYLVQDPLRCNGKEYAVGTTIKLDQKTAAQLLELKTIVAK